MAPRVLLGLVAPAAELAAHAVTSVPALMQVHAIPTDDGWTLCGSDGAQAVRTKWIAACEGERLPFNLPHGEFTRALSALGEEDAELTLDEILGPVTITSPTARFSFRQSTAEPPPMTNWAVDETCSLLAQNLADALSAAAPITNTSIGDKGLEYENCVHLHALDGSLRVMAMFAGMFLGIIIPEVSVNEPAKYALTPRQSKLLQGMLGDGTVALHGLQNLSPSCGRHSALLPQPAFEMPDWSKAFSSDDFEQLGSAHVRKVDLETALNRAGVYGHGAYKKGQHQPLYIRFRYAGQIGLGTLEDDTGTYSGSLPCEWAGEPTELNLAQGRLKLALNAMRRENLTLSWGTRNRVRIQAPDDPGVFAILGSKTIAGPVRDDETEEAING